MKHLLVLTVLALLTGGTVSVAVETPQPTCRTVLPGERPNDIPARVPDGFTRADTLDFGYFTTIGGQYYAVLGGMWTWDHGSSNTYEGWYAVDHTANTADYFRQITSESWAGHGNAVAAPIIDGAGSVWLGIFEDEADLLCWGGGLGYGNHWCQRLTSREFTWNGPGDVNLAFTYFSGSEPGFDYTKVLLANGASPVPLNGDGFTGTLGAPPAGPWAGFSRAITPGELGTPGSTFRISFEFVSDGGWSDEDGQFLTQYGPFGFDDLNLTGDVAGGPFTYDFESGLGPDWTASRCPGIGSFFSIRPLSQYVIQDPCRCKLAGNVAAFHDEERRHPVGQSVSALSPAADRTSYQSYNRILCQWDQYSELPQASGVFYRPGWRYYPYLCPATGATQWSPRSGQLTWHYAGDQPVCNTSWNVATNWGIPADCQQVGFVYEVYSSCDEFGIPPTQCLGYQNTDFTPVIDNVRIRMTSVPDAPAVNFDSGDQYIDGFPQTASLGVLSPGNAKVARYTNSNTGENRWILGDSLVVAGPPVTPSTKWESKIWFRVRREGPGQIHLPAYRSWKDRVADGRQIVGAQGQYTFGWMDSVEVGPQVARNKFDTYFKESDDDYTPGSGSKPDIGPQNKIILDGILTPGTKIEYFVTTNYICMPTTFFYLPDTTGGFAYEFEILPSYRTVTDGTVPPGYGPYRYPCILYVDAYDRGAQRWLEGALNITLNGASPENAFDIPDPTSWDRYDYTSIGCCYQSPFIRGYNGSNNGATVIELLGYKMIIWNTGNFGADGGTSEYMDFYGLADWLGNATCYGNVNAQAFWGSGDGFAGAASFQHAYPQFLTDYCGATYDCSPYDAPACPSGDPDNDENYCVRLEDVGSGWTNGIPLDIWGNWCPQKYGYSVLGTTGSGVAEKAFRKIGGGLTNYAQVRNDQLGGPNRYRTVVDGYSFHHLIQRNGNDPQTECVYDTTRILNAIVDEFGGLARWDLNLGAGYDLTSLGLCLDPCLDPLAAPDGPGSDAVFVDRLEQNTPNPFNPGTTIRFSLARGGPARISIYDVNGRLVRTLVDGPLSAGPHVAVWDGLDGSGRRVPAGIYWSALHTERYDSNRKMVVVR